MRPIKSALSVVDRSLIGSPADYLPDPGLSMREHELKASQRARRTAAWQAVARVVEQVPLDESLLPEAKDPSVRAFQTWFARDDLSRLFARAYGQLSDDERAMRMPLSPTSIKKAFLWNDQAVDDFEEWTAERLAAYQRAVHTGQQASGLGGLYRVTYGAKASAHILESYGDVLRCREQPPKSSTTPAPPEEQTLYSAELSLKRCADWALEPVALGKDESLRIAFVHDGGAGSVTVRWKSQAGGEQACEPLDDALCTVKGPTVVHVAARTDQQALQGALQVVRIQHAPLSAPCLRNTFPTAAVVVKADWQRAQFGLKLPVYDTSAAALTQRLSRKGDVSWVEPDDEADPTAEDIYTIELPNKNVFRLAALHIMTKELDHWFWITLWWSPEPDHDFGADRPKILAAPWQHYKMCTVVAFEEGDPDATGGYAGNEASLGEALAATHGGVGKPTWCSNPYLERGTHNAATNCIGCHQHAGSFVPPEIILNDDEHYPAYGRTAIRTDFPTDYVFALSAGDDLGAMFQTAEGLSKP